MGGFGTYLLIDSGLGKGEGHAFDRQMGMLFLAGATVFAIQSIRAMACSRDVTWNRPDEIEETTTKAVCGSEHEPYTNIRIISEKLNVDEIVETDANGSFSVQALTGLEPGTSAKVFAIDSNGLLIGEYKIER